MAIPLSPPTVRWRRSNPIEALLLVGMVGILGASIRRQLSAEEQSAWKLLEPSTEDLPQLPEPLLIPRSSPLRLATLRLPCADLDPTPPIQELTSAPRIRLSGSLCHGEEQLRQLLSIRLQAKLPQRRPDALSSQVAKLNTDVELFVDPRQGRFMTPYLQLDEGENTFWLIQTNIAQLTQILPIVIRRETLSSMEPMNERALESSLEPQAPHQ